jgi:CNT family concentrative nucleoside transporter
MNYLHYGLTVFLTLAISFLLSENKKSINVKLILIGLLLQIVFAIIMLKIPFISESLAKFNVVLIMMQKSTVYATEFIFGGLADPQNKLGLGYIFFLQGLPSLIVISAISSVLMYCGVLPFIIKVFSGFFEKVLRIGGILGFSISISMFSGINETPLVVNRYLKNLTHSELFSILVYGNSITASSMLVVYSGLLKPIIPDSFLHIMVAFVISIPTALLVSRMIVPETDKDSSNEIDLNYSNSSNLVDAIQRGIISGGKAVVIIAVMLLGFIALTDFVNQIILAINPTDYEITIQKILGFVLFPLTWVIGIPTNEASIAATLIGERIVLNELISFQELVHVAQQLSHKTRIMMVYVLCSFGNIGTIGAMVGVYGSLVPERQEEIIKFSFKALLAGLLVNLLNASIIGMLYN